MLELSAPIQPRQIDFEDDTLSTQKQDSNANVEALEDIENHDFKELQTKNNGSNSPYFSTYYSPTTPPSPDTIIEVDPEQFKAEVCQAIGRVIL